MSPQRLHKAKGSRTPPGAVFVGQGTKWNNPYRNVSGRLTPEQIVIGYDLAVRAGYDHVPGPDEIKAELAGKDLACWCPLDQPCHADVLLEVANR